MDGRSNQLVETTKKQFVGVTTWRFKSVRMTRYYRAVNEADGTVVKLGDDLEIAWHAYKKLRRGIGLAVSLLEKYNHAGKQQFEYDRLYHCRRQQALGL